MPNLLERLNTRCPIWNAGMGGALAGPELVSAVSNAGGFGVLGAGAMPPHLVTGIIEQTRERTSRPFGANIILPMSDGRDVEACFDARVEVLVLFWGDPQPYVADAHRRGMHVVAQCGDGNDAALAVEAGVDAVIVQGSEAGGHVKARAPLRETIAEARAAVGDVPLIAAGGIATGADIHAALALGAGAVSLGTRFLASRESLAVEAYKERVVAAHADDTVMTKMFDLGWPDASHRVIRNSAYEAWDAAGRPASGSRPGEGETIAEFDLGGEKVSVPRYAVYPPAIGFEGDIDAAALYAGESVERIDRIDSVADIMATLMAELRAAAA
ncbi:MAG: NAD(P)H-dependent flavin oxidoreductase [Gammaproteobacteria bacterium]